MLFDEKLDIAGYLGVLLDEDTDNDSITFRQCVLAHGIDQALHLNCDTSPVETQGDFIYPLNKEGEPSDG